MKIGIVTLSRIEEDMWEKYNLQSYGLGIALEKLGYQVVVYSFEKRSTAELVEIMGDNILVKHYSANAIGNHSLAVTKYIDTDLDSIVCFSDNQISFPCIYAFCKQHNIPLYPYVGILTSHNQNKIFSMIMNVLAKPNQILYRRSIIFAKTKEIQEELTSKKILNVILCPVGLIEERLNLNYNSYNKKEIKKSLGFEMDCDILLYVGRFVEEKRPYEMVHLFHDLNEETPSLRMCMIGKGPLKNGVIREINNLGLQKCVYLMDEVSNSEIWQYYLASSCFINLNRQEIFGMAILEAMFYECPVVAYAAPGPSTIICHGKNGYLAENMTQIKECTRVALKLEHLQAAHDTVTKYYMWDYSASKMKEIIDSHLSQKRKLFDGDRK